MERIGLEGSFAIAEAARLARTEAIAAYPITPQTHIVERLAEMVANRELDAEYIPVESEHSAMSACLGSCATGARTFTATSGQGLALMHEVLFVASSMRLPIVMAVSNRALSAPLSIWGDHSDVMANRDSGWLQVFAENGQQAFDLTIAAFKIAEDPRVMFPIMVNVDGFNLSHVVEPLYMLDQETVDKFLPPFKYPYVLDPNKPLTLGAFGMPYIYTEVKKAQDVATRATKRVIGEVWDEYAQITGRKYNFVESYRTEDADTVLLMMGSFMETASTAIDAMREEGQKVGMVRIRLWRPFPFEEIAAALSRAKTVVVLDRSISLGGPPGPVCSEVRAALYPLAKRPSVVSIIGALGGREISPEGFRALINDGAAKAASVSPGDFEMIGVRG
jgi:pyruvate ferredoxin oxidoreductase alpha subunit